MHRRILAGYASGSMSLLRQKQILRTLLRSYKGVHPPKPMRHCAKYLRISENL